MKVLDVRTMVVVVIPRFHASPRFQKNESTRILSIAVQLLALVALFLPGWRDQGRQVFAQNGLAPWLGSHNHYYFKLAH